MSLISTYISGEWVGWEKLKTVYAIRKGFEQQAIEDQQEKSVKHRIYGVFVYDKHSNGESYLKEARFYLDKGYETDEEFSHEVENAQKMWGDIRVLAIHEHE